MLSSTITIYPHEWVRWVRSFETSDTCWLILVLLVFQLLFRCRRCAQQFVFFLLLLLTVSLCIALCRSTAARLSLHGHEVFLDGKTYSNNHGFIFLTKPSNTKRKMRARTSMAWLCEWKFIQFSSVLFFISRFFCFSTLSSSQAAKQ